MIIVFPIHPLGLGRRGCLKGSKPSVYFQTKGMEYLYMFAREGRGELWQAGTLAVFVSRCARASGRGRVGCFLPGMAGIRVETARMIRSPLIVVQLPVAWYFARYSLLRRPLCGR